MAFGKNKTGAAYSKMNLRQQMKRSSTRERSSGGGGKGSWRNKYLPPTKGPPDIIRLIPGNYEVPRVDKQARDYFYDDRGQIITDPHAYWMYIEYYNAPKRKYVIGSEGPLGEFKGKGDPCLAADWYWWEWRQRRRNNSKRPNTIARKEKYVWSVLVEAPFYKVPQVDERGVPRMNPNTGEPYYEWLKGSKKGNDEYAAAGYERKEGHLMHWSMGYGHWAILSDHANQLGKFCKSCGNSEESIEEVALICQGCGFDVINFAETSLDEEELADFREKETKCPECGFVGYLEDMVTCTSCDTADPATLFDFDLKVKRVETTATDGGTQTALQIVGAIGPRPIPSMYGEDLRQALDLPKIFEPDSMEMQEDKLGVPPDDEDVMVDSPQAQRKPSRQPVHSSRAYGNR